MSMVRYDRFKSVISLVTIIGGLLSYLVYSSRPELIFLIPGQNNFQRLFCATAFICIISSMYVLFEELMIKKEIDNLIKEKAIELSIQKSKLIYKDCYGNIITKKWDAEKKYFFNKNIIPEFETDSYKYEFVLNSENYIKVKIDKILKYTTPSPNKLYEISSGTAKGIHFENECIEILKEQGWKAECTERSGDYGADIIASKKNYRLIIQCKDYVGNVGISAVQEAYSALPIYKGNRSVVVCRGKFTKKAQITAYELNVILLHFDQLKSIEKYIV